MLKSIDKPDGYFGGRNFMTPLVLGYYALRHGYAELSEGTGISHQPIFGVTVQPDTEKRSKVFQTRSAALHYIRDMS